MKKTIKFRAWDEGNQQMLYFAEAEKLMEYAGVFFRIIKPVKFPCDFADLMQWTGLKDKNGKEIYEGDIIRHINEEADHTPYEVPSMTPENWELLVGIGDSEWDEGDNRYSNIEVIGNIYENSELINSSK